MIGNSFHLQPHPLPTLAVVLFVPLFSGLGIWQLERAEQKRNTATMQQSRVNQAPLDLNEYDNLGAEQAEYRRLRATGVLLPKQGILIENRKFQGRHGFHVVMPLRMHDGRNLLVNRGWVAAGKGLSVPHFYTPEGEITISGRATLPSPPALRLQRSAGPGQQQRWPYLTLEEYRNWSGLDVYPFLLLQTDTGTQGFERVWPLEPVDDSMHIGYALQWFAFAVIALAIWLRLSWVRHPNRTGVVDGNH